MESVSQSVSLLVTFRCTEITKAKETNFRRRASRHDQSSVPKKCRLETRSSGISNTKLSRSPVLKSLASHVLDNLHSIERVSSWV